MSGFRFHVGNRGEVKVVVFDDGGCRPASDAEVEMWDALVALRAENEQFREQARHVLPRAAMLSAVHGALIDAGCTVGELGRCEAALVRELAVRVEVAEGARNTADAERKRLMDEVERLTTERDDASDLARAHHAMLEDARAELERLRGVAEKVKEYHLARLAWEQAPALTNEKAHAWARMEHAQNALHEEMRAALAEGAGE